MMSATPEQPKQSGQLVGQLTWQLAQFRLPNRLVLAPMAGITDRPFRQLCKRMGAGMAVGEMISANNLLWGSKKTRSRIDHQGEIEPRTVQIAGSDPQQLAAAAQFNQDQGAQIIDINMGCPAKKVCNVMAGSALLRDEALVGRILEAVVNAVDVPVTLKIRTGWSPAQRNGVRIAKIAENSGIQALAVHGRTRACAYKGAVEYDTIRAIKHSVNIPIMANGDISSPERAAYVLDYTGADALMIGRGAQGNPWIFQHITHYLKTGERLAPPSRQALKETVLEHLQSLYSFYGEYTGVRMARKHLAWYSKHLRNSHEFRQGINRVENSAEQYAMSAAFFT